MTPRESFITALDGGQPGGRVPHFELVFFLTMEAFGQVHPTHRRFGQWGQMSRRERDLHVHSMAELYVRIAETYEHSAIYVLPPNGWREDRESGMVLVHAIRELTGQRYCLMLPGDATYSIPGGSTMMEFCGRLAEDPQGMKDQAQQRVDAALQRAEQFAAMGELDGFILTADYCFNDNPFFSPAMFDDFVGPYLAQLCKRYRELGFYVIKHTDGNIMPILDRLVDAGPHALHSIDPQGGVDIAEVKKLVGDRICLVGNVNCGLLDTGTDEDVIASARYALKSGMPGGGYIFSTSNCIYTGMDLKRYDLILDVWRKEGNYE